MSDIVERLKNTKPREVCEHGSQRVKCPLCDLEQAEAEIERLREENERYRTALLGICRPVWSTPPIDSEAANVYASICREMINIAQFALAAATAHTPANTADAATNENDATP